MNNCYVQRRNLGLLRLKMDTVIPLADKIEE